MNTTIQFTHLGLTFDADCYVEPFVPGHISGPPESCYPDEGGYVEINRLSCGDMDASFLLNSELREDLTAAACAALEIADNEPDYSDDWEHA